jgi:hypothetical protein
MFYNKVDTEEIFDSYAKLMQDGGHLEKKANYVVSKSLLSDDLYTEIDVTRDLQKIAAGADSKKLNKLFAGNDLMDEAHPEGSVETVKAADDLGVVETLADRQKVMIDIATAKVKLAQKLFTLAASLEQDGFANLVPGLDKAASELLNQGNISKQALPEMPADSGNQGEPAPHAGQPAAEKANQQPATSKGGILQKNIHTQTLLNDVLNELKRAGQDVEIENAHGKITDDQKKWLTYYAPGFQTKGWNFLWKSLLQAKDKARAVPSKPMAVTRVDQNPAGDGNKRWVTSTS